MRISNGATHLEAAAVDDDRLRAERQRAEGDPARGRRVARGPFSRRREEADALVAGLVGAVVGVVVTGSD